MSLIIIIGSVIVLSGLGLIFGLWLAFSEKRLAVKEDPRVEKVEEVLPGSNCGACGYPGCSGLAKAIVEGKEPPSRCPVGGDEAAKRIGDILGIEVEAEERKLAVLRCNGGNQRAKDKYEYRGIETCQAASLLGYGQKACDYACLGFGDCAQACPFDAITMSEEGLPIIDAEKCAGCGICVEICPKDVLELISRSQTIYVACNSTDAGRSVRKICKGGCIACKLCEKVCPVDAIHVEDNLARIDPEKCTACGKCVEKCPTNVIIDLRERIKDQKVSSGSGSSTADENTSS